MNAWSRWSLVALASLAACRAAPTVTTPLGHASRSADRASYELRRVGFLPIENRAGGEQDLNGLQGALALELARSARFEALVLDPADIEETVQSAPHRKGWYDPRTVLQLSQRFALDALVVTSLTQAQAYPPQQLVLQLDMIACETGLVVWTAHLQLDAADREVRQAIHAYRDARRSMEDQPEPVEWTLLSPERFARFAAYELARLY